MTRTRARNSRMSGDIARLTFRRTYSSWSHDKGVPGKVVAQLMGHANVDTTLNVLHASPRRRHSGRRRQDRRRIVHDCSRTERRGNAKSLKTLVGPAGLEPATSW